MLWEKKMLWDEDAQCGILKPTTSLLVQARAVEKARRELGQCPHCHTALAVLPWCPLCAAEEPPVTAWRLPERELTVWRRIFFAAPGPLPPVLPAGPTPPAPDTEPTGDEDDREDTDTDNTGDDNEN
jgi:hypothetical protein